MDFKDFSSLSKLNKTAESVVRHLSQKARSPKGGVIDLSHFRSGVRKAPGFNHQEYDAFWKALAKRGFGKYVAAQRAGEHAKFIPSQDIIEFAKMATGQLPTNARQEDYDRENPASSTVEGPVFQIGTLIMKNLNRMSQKEVNFLISMLESKSSLS